MKAKYFHLLIPPIFCIFTLIILFKLLDHRDHPTLALSSVHYVAPDGNCGTATPCYTNVQNAVTAANPGDEIRIAAGEYTGTIGRPAPPGYGGPPMISQIVYLTKSIILRGGYTHTNWTFPDSQVNRTILNAEGQGRIFFIAGNIAPVIQYLSMEGGDATDQGGGNPPFNTDAGGGIYVYSATITLLNNAIESNQANLGGGIYALQSSAILAGNYIAGNAAWSGGGIFLEASAFSGISNAFVQNLASSSGGGIATFYSDATIKQNTVVSNTANGGGGLYFERGQISLEENLIMANQAAYGGGLEVTIDADVTLFNNVIVDNQGSDTGSGILMTAGTTRFTHNTIARNEGGDGTGLHILPGPFGFPSRVWLTNTILVSHTIGISISNVDSTADINGVLWYGNGTNTRGIGSITVTNAITGSPKFALDGFHINADSAARGMGVPTSVLNDIDFEPRQQASPDLGADEHWLPGELRILFLPLITNES